jgi:hypothetical protein
MEYNSVAPFPTKRGKIHQRKLKIKKALSPIKKGLTKAKDWVKKDLAEATPAKIRQFPRNK